GRPRVGEGGEGQRREADAYERGSGESQGREHEHRSYFDPVPRSTMCPPPGIKGRYSFGFRLFSGGGSPRSTSVLPVRAGSLTFSRPDRGPCPSAAPATTSSTGRPRSPAADSPVSRARSRSSSTPERPKLRAVTAKPVPSGSFSTSRATPGFSASGAASNSASASRYFWRAARIRLSWDAKESGSCSCSGREPYNVLALGTPYADVFAPGLAPVRSTPPRLTQR